MAVSRRKLCGALFWLKVFAAVLLAFSALGFMGFNIYRQYMIGLANKPTFAAPIDIPSTGCAADTRLARLEVPDGEQLVGFHLDWSKLTPIQLRAKVGFAPAIVNAFLQLDTTRNPPIDWAMFDWHGQEANRISATLQITVEPSRSPSEISTIPDTILDQIAQQCLKINTKYGTPVFLRFGHEMNGDWTYYGMQPIEFKLGFQRMAIAVRKVTNMTAMVWGPNLGVNYPFLNGGVPLPARGTPNFLQLDTNGDGVIDIKDDPYTPYYPGDDYVDWVGMSLYWYPDAGTGFNNLPDPTFFIDQLTSNGPSVQKYQPACNGQANKNFYQNFAVQRNKPLMIPETSAPWVPGVVANSFNGTATPQAIKENWWNQIFSDSVRSQYPKIKAACWFEETKADAGNELRNWQVTDDPTVLATFSKDFKALNAAKKVAFAPNVKTSCSGSLGVKF
ncbi:glycoside hydrolase superfamily [Gorgonomyces haynaldii]|nr:glycoside hydrolase superfamily [Gorgonomyces haynaldii]